MRTWLAIIVMGMLVGGGGCAARPRAPEVTVTPAPADEHSAGSASAMRPTDVVEPVEVVIHAGRRELLTLRRAVGEADGAQLTYVFAALPVSDENRTTAPSQDAARVQLVFQGVLRPVGQSSPSIPCRIVRQHRSGDVSVVIAPPSELSGLRVLARLAPGLLPVRLEAGDGCHVGQSAIGPAVDLLFDAVADLDHRQAWPVSGRVRLLPGWPHANEMEIHVTCPGDGGETRILAIGGAVASLPGAHESRVLSHVEPHERDVWLARMRRDVWRAALAGDVVRSGPTGPPVSVEPRAIWQQVMPNGLIRLVDHCACGRPELWNLAVARPFDRWNVLGVFNDSWRPSWRSIRLGQLGIKSNEGERFAVWDHGRQQLLAITEDEFDVHVAPASARLLGVRRVRAGQPVLLEAGAHVSGGGNDLKDCRYDPAASVMQGVVYVTPYRPYEVELLLPTEPPGLEIARVAADGARVGVRQEGPVRFITLAAGDAREVSWQAHFKPSAPDWPLPSAPTGLMVRQSTRGVGLAWQSGPERAARYRIYRDDHPVADVAGDTFAWQDSGVMYHRAYRYHVAALDWSDRESPRGEAVTHHTPIPANAYLTQLEPLSVEPAGTRLGINESLDGQTLRMRARRYHRGLSCPSGTRLTYFLGGGYSTFSGEIGIDDETGGRGEAIFEIHADGEIRYQSPVIRGGDRPRRFSVLLAGCRLLELVVRDTDGETTHDHADWGDAYLHAAEFSSSDWPEETSGGT